MISESTLSFLKDLKNNNDKDWFRANKTRYEIAREEFTIFIEELITQIRTFDSALSILDPKTTIFRIHRDVRFSKNKDPYKTNFGAHIICAHKKSDIHSRAGYYLSLEPGETMLAGGAYLPKAPWLKAIREEINHDSETFKGILNDKTFKKYFGTIEGEQLKTAPRDYPKDHPDIDLLRYKSYLAVHRCSDELVLSEGFLARTVQVFKALYPFDQFLNRS